MLTLSQVNAAFKASNAVLASKSHAIRSYFLKAILIVIALFFYGSLIFSINVGFIAYTLITNPQVEQDSLPTALEIMKAFGNSDYSFAGAIGILAFLSYIIFSPLIGTAALSIISEDESVSLGLPRGYRFFNSLILNMISAVSILQLIIGFGIASLFSIEGNRAPSIIMFSLLWIMGSIVSTFLGWVREYLVQKIGFVRTLLFSLIVLASLLLVIAQEAVRFQIGNLYGVWFTRLAAIDVPTIATSLIAIIAISLSLIYFGTSLASLVVSRSYPSENKASSFKVSFIGKAKTRLAVLASIIHTAVWRTREIRRTILIVMILSSASAFFVIPEEISIIGLLISIPAIISLSWLINVFGLLGGGILVLAGDKEKYKAIPGASLIYAFALSIVCSLPVLIGLLYGGRIDSNAFTEYLSVSILTSALLPAIAILMAVRRPFRARLEGRGDTLVPPLVSLGYIILIGGIAMVTGSFVLAATGGIYASVLFLLTTVLLLALTYHIANYYWVKKENQYRIMKIINGD